ncbi:hypothetical protein LQ938_04460 [Microbacterium sp. cx-55]|uniref:hypothetical protein n=1 Tax=Microbacterium sp. cx-55 TaxID=2875948 RepID=UPI001CBEA8E3|nr:hypothetical protein [Microbacterium sp. cx-55]MBZ4488708.1 hypothetical protein [Microbacterium sp. cx-55]UGB36053.1 hypothetical protein LQ938_04460 [Microbacterium sp. cx-55]
MQPPAPPDIEVYRRKDRDGMPVNDRRLRAHVEAGLVHRVYPGSFVSADAWNGLRARERHHILVIEAAEHARGPLVITHDSAAAVWGMERLGTWPERVDTRIDRRTGGRSTGLIRRRAWGTNGIDLVPWGSHWITSPAQTALDLAADSSFTSGVVALDQALWGRREGDPLVQVPDLRAAAEHADVGRGVARMRMALEFVTPMSDSVRESQSRVAIHRLGFPAPILQQRFLLGGGRVAYTDFFFEAHAHVGEFDGVGKYVDAALLRGRTPQQALLAEKDREDALRRRIRGLSRWRTPELQDVRLLYDILSGAGLPTSSPRPRSRLQFV